MSCGHCEKTIRDELLKTSPEAKITVDLKNKTVEVENLTDDQVMHTLNEIGFTPEKIK